MNHIAERNPSLLVTASALRSALFPIPVITIFWKDVIGMSLSDIMQLQAIFSATVVALEFPSGYIADRLGFRLALLTGAVFWLLGWVVYALGATFTAMVFAEVLLGIGLAFTSGSDSALLFVSLKANDQIVRYTRWEGRVRAAAQVSEAMSAGVGGFLYSIAPRLPFWFQVPSAAVHLGIVARTREVTQADAGKRMAHLARAWHVVRYALVHHARLRSAMVLSVALGISTYVAVWLIQPWMQRRGIPAAWFGPIWAAAHLWLAANSLLSGRIGRAFGLARTLLGCCVLVAGSYTALGISTSAVAVVFYLGFMSVRGLQGPLLANVMQADAPPEDRASVLSLNTLLFRLASVVVLPPVGALADRWGIEPVLAFLGIVAGIATLVVWFLFTRAHAMHEQNNASILS
jgi:MFS family permease